MVISAGTTPRQSIADAFAQLKQRGRVGLMPFVPAGYPDLKSTQAILPAMQRGGASAIEIGIPFSDPVADGPVIQEAFNVALSHKLKLDQIFQTIATTRSSVQIPLIAMVSYSIVFRYGVQRFAKTAHQAGFDGLIVPDLPPPEAQKVCDDIRSADLDTILLVAPTTSAQRRREIAALCSGFVYYMSVTGITGERTALPADLAQNLDQLRSVTDRPIAVGFGISQPQHVAQLAGHADAAIVGSGVVRQISHLTDPTPDTIAASIEQYCKFLLS
ncbi:MAG: tryptophan synthase subunit alpha [Phycisphaerales bacterium]|jgi:tryptophan synthase alpha chain|nr:tryptophan synthase subunit alpha [Phycisphaerales bacterium]